MPRIYAINLGGGSGGGGIESINADTTAAQTLVTGTAGTDFAIVDDGSGAHTFNLPVASATNTGKLSNTDWSTFNSKQSTISFANVGSSPNSAGGGISGGTITLQPANGTNPGLVSTTTQTFAGAKTFNNAIYINNAGSGSSRLGITGSSDSGVYVMEMVGTFNDSTRIVNWTGAANTGADTGGRQIQRITISGSYNAAGRTGCLHGINQLSASGTAVGVWNTALQGTSEGNGAWHVGVYGETDSGAATTSNFGVRGRANTSTTNAGTCGVAGVGATNASGVNVGVFGMVDTNTNVGAAVPNASAAGLFNNGATTKDIIVAQDNGTKAFAIVDGGVIQTNQATADTGTPATTAYKIPIYDTSNTLLGYIAVFDDF